MSLGLPAERNLLGSLILRPDNHHFIDGLVASTDFSDPRMGTIFDNIIRMLSAGEQISEITIEQHLNEWGIRGIPPGATFEWTGPEAGTAPSLTIDYAEKTRDDSVRRGLDHASRFITTEINDGASPLETATKTIHTLQNLIDGSASGKLKTKSLAEVLEQTDTRDWVIPDLLERQDRVIFTGAEGAGKTTFARQLLVLAAAGVHPLTFNRIPPIKVLIVDAENTETQWRRQVRGIVNIATQDGTADPALNVHMVAGDRIDITHGSHLSEIHRLIDNHTPDILYIGPLYKLVPNAINNDDDAAPLIVALDSLRARGVVLVMEAHAGKSLGSNGERDLKPRGSAALMGWPEFGMGLRPSNTSPDIYDLVRWRGAREEGRAWPKALHRGGPYFWTPADL